MAWCGLEEEWEPGSCSPPSKQTPERLPQRRDRPGKTFHTNVLVGISKYECLLRQQHELSKGWMSLYAKECECFENENEAYSAFCCSLFLSAFSPKSVPAGRSWAHWASEAKRPVNFVFKHILAVMSGLCLQNTNMSTELPVRTVIFFLIICRPL